MKLLLSKEEQLLPPDVESLEAEIGQAPPARTVIAEIAGRDSIAAVLSLVSHGGIETVVPTIAYTGTEYGDWEVIDVTLRRLEVRLAEMGVRTTSPVFLGSPPLWAALNGRAMSRLAERFGFCTPCIGCHLYVHMVRVPLARRLKVKRLISGERESHDGRVKINQTAEALDAYREVLAVAKIELELPIRDVVLGKEIERIVGEGWQEGAQQLSCVLSGNYEGGHVLPRGLAVRRFLDEYVVKAGQAIIAGWMRGGQPDYSAVVDEMLEAGETS